MSTYIVSDLHGRLDLYQEIEKFRKSGDTIICLGDCGDRGPKSFETIKAVANNPDWKYFMGNHEHMTAEALMEEQYFVRSRYYDNAIEISFDNGGQDTFNGCLADGYQKWINFFTHLPYHDTYHSDTGLILDLSHSGREIQYDTPELSDYIWDRSHLYMPWPTDEKYANIVMVHGHTPIPAIDKKWKPSDGAKWTCGNHKVNIDAGSVWTGATILLNADTLDEIILDAGQAEKEEAQ